MVVESLYRFGLGFLASVFVARHLGPSDYGLFSFVLSCVMLFSFFYKLGVDDLVMKCIFDNPEDRAAIVLSGLVIKFIGGVLGFTLINISLFFWSSQPLLISYLILLYSAFFLLKFTDVFEASLRTKNKFFEISLWKTIIFTLTTSFKFIAVYMQLKVEFFIYISCVELFLIAIFFTLYHEKTFRRLEYLKRIDLKLFTMVFRKAIPLSLIIFFVEGMGRVDQILIKEFSSLSDLGNYAVSAKIIMLMTYIPTAILAAIYPEMITSQNNQEKMYALVKEYSSLVLSFSLFLSLGVFFLGDFVIDIVYGGQYKGAATYLFLYSLVTFFSYLGLLRFRYAFLRSIVRLELLLCALCLILNIVLSVILIPRYGPIGAIYATLLSHFIFNLTIPVSISSYRRFYLEYFLGFLYIKKSLQGVSRKLKKLKV